MSWLSRAVERRYGGVVERYSAEMEPFERAVLRQARSRLLADLRGRVLEIGAGLGQSFPAYPASAHVTAIEPDPLFRAVAKRAAQSCPAAIEVVDGDAHNLDFPDASFDGLVCSIVLCSLGEPGQALSELHRVLRPGAEARFLEHVRSSSPPAAALQRLMQPAWHLFDGSTCSLVRDSLSTIRQAGFVVDHVSEVGLPGWVGVLFPGLEIYAHV